MSCEDVDDGIVALIPAKGHSERLPRKNLAMLGGKPLLLWTIEAAKASGLYDSIWVSTEDSDIATLAVESGADLHMRPDALAGPDVTVDDVVAHFRRDRPYSHVSILLPTSPFRSVERMRLAWERYCALHPAKLLSVVKADQPEWAMRFDGVTLLPGWDNAIPRGKLRPAYKHDGAHHIITPYPTSARWVGIPGEFPETVDINTFEDLEWAEYLLQKGRVPWLTASR